MKVYAVEKNPDSLLLVDGLHVVNGGYNLLQTPDPLIMEIPHTGFKAYEVGEVGDSYKYNEVLEKFREEHQ